MDGTAVRARDGVSGAKTQMGYTWARTLQVVSALVSALGDRKWICATVANLLVGQSDHPAASGRLAWPDVLRASFVHVERIRIQKV
jgi:hypothetical protein